MAIWRSVRARSLLTVLPLLVTRPTQAAGAIPDDPFEELAAHQEARLAAARTAGERLGPLIELMDLATVMRRGRVQAAVAAQLDKEKEGEDQQLVAAVARSWLARRAEERGDEAAAADLRAPLGALTKVWVVGPFGDGRSSFDEVYPPESEWGNPDPARSYAGKERSVGWRRGAEAVVRGELELGALLRPETQTAAYVLAFVHVDHGGDAAVRLGSPGPLKVWCNGALAYAADRVRSARFDQDAVGVHLAPGWNRLLIKTVVTEGTWRLFARLTRPDGGRLVFTDAWEAPATTPSPSRATKGRIALAPKVAVRGLEPLMRERVRAAVGLDAAALAGVDLGRYLLAFDPADRDRKEAAAAFEQSSARRPTVEALLGLASAGREQDESRRALERALEAARLPRDRARVLSSLGDIARDQHRETVAVQRWRAAETADPRWWPAALSLAGEELAAGFPGAGLARLQALPAEVRALPVVARARARMLLALDRRAEAEAIWRGLAADDRMDVDLLHELAGAARNRGDGVEAVRLLERAARLRPELPSLTLEWARALEGARQADAARAALERAAARLPHEPALAAELGKLLDRGGKASEAQVWLRTALALRPQDPELRRYADAVATRASQQAAGARRRAGRGSDGEDGSDLARRFALSVPDLLAAAATPAVAGHAGAAREWSPASAPGGDPDPAIVLLDRRAVRVHANGLSEAFAQRVVEVRTDAGARDNQEFLVRYTPGSEEVEILEARIFRRGAGGALEVLSSSDRDDQDLSEPWYGLYYDYRAEVVRFEGLRAGDVLEVQYLVSDVARENHLGGYFGDLQFISEGIPKRRWDYTLMTPPGREFHFARPAVAGLEETVTDERGERVTAFRARDIPRIEVEPAMPGLGEVAPYLHVSTYASWDEVGTWYWHLVEEQLAPDDTIRRAAEGATRPVDGRALTLYEKVRALHALVVGGTRYVGLEFGIHGFRPYKVSQVLARKFGDCKDKAALLVALLGEAGIEAEMVLVRTRRNGRIAPAPASLAVFDHAIVFVPKLGIYLDGTAEFSGMRELPSQDQGVMVLRVGSHGTKLVETPVLPSAENRAVRQWQARLRADGDADVEERLEITGQAAPDWRSHYQTRGERLDRYAKVWTGRNPGARLVSVEMTGIDDRNRSVLVQAKAGVPRLGEPGPDGSLLLLAGARDADLVRTYARLSERRTDLVLGYPWRHEEHIDYALPAGYEVTSIPESRHIESKFGRFDLRVEKPRPGVVATDARLDVSQDRIVPADYPEFRRFLADVDATLAEKIVVAPAGEQRHAEVAPEAPAGSVPAVKAVGAR